MKDERRRPLHSTVTPQVRPNLHHRLTSPQLGSISPRAGHSFTPPSPLPVCQVVLLVLFLGARESGEHFFRIELPTRDDPRVDLATTYGTNAPYAVAVLSGNCLMKEEHGATAFPGGTALQTSCLDAGAYFGAVNGIPSPGYFSGTATFRPHWLKRAPHLATSLELNAAPQSCPRYLGAFEGGFESDGVNRQSPCRRPSTM